MWGNLQQRLQVPQILLVIPSFPSQHGSRQSRTNSQKILRRAICDAPVRLYISFASRGSRQREHRELAAERSVIAQRGIAAHRTQAVMGIGKAGR